MIIHPTFDPKTSSWFFDDRRAPANRRREARTIRELLALYPAGTTVKDYHPAGDRRLPRDLISPEAKKVVEAPGKPAGAPKGKKLPKEPPEAETSPAAPAERLDPLYPPGPERDEAIMTLWPATSAAEIARKLRIAKGSVINCVHKMRAKKDPRADRYTEVAEWMVPGKATDEAAPQT